MFIRTINHFLQLAGQVAGHRQPLKPGESWDEDPEGTATISMWNPTSIAAIAIDVMYYNVGLNIQVIIVFWML